MFTFYHVVAENDLEGVIYKDLTSSYLIGGKDQRWQKKKNQKDIIAVVGGVTYRDSIINSLLLGLYDQEGQLWYIGNVGTGKLTHQDWRDLTEGIKHITRGVSWLRPILTVKIRYLEWAKGHKLRQPSIQAIATVPATECVFT